MKRQIFALALLATTLGASAQQYYGRVQDSDGYTNIRKGPGTDYAIVRRYQTGEYLYYTPQGNGWSKVYSGDKSSTFMGYMNTSRIVRINPNSSSDNSFRTGRITDPKDSYVNVRKGPGTDYAIVSRLYVGNRVYYKPAANGWVKVYNANKQFLGYIAKSRVY